MAAPPEGPTALYRLFNQAGELIYIGISHNPAVRFQRHKYESSWWPEVDRDRTIIEWHPTRPLAKAAETTALRADRPTHNLLETGRRAPGLPVPIPTEEHARSYEAYCLYYGIP